MIAPSYINSSTLPQLVHLEKATSIPATPRLSQGRHVHLGNVTAIPGPQAGLGTHHDGPQASPIVVGLSHHSGPLPSSARLSRRRHGSPVVGTALPSSARLSRRRHGSPVVGTALPSSPCLCRPRHVCVHCHVHPGHVMSVPEPQDGPLTISDDAGRSQTMQDVLQPYRTFSNHTGRSPTIQDVYHGSRVVSNNP